jgi:hypothetical protein
MRIVIVALLLFLGSGPVALIGNERLGAEYGALMIGVPIVMFLYRLFAPGGIKVVVVESRPTQRWINWRPKRSSGR